MVNPTDFQNTATAWIGSITAVVIIGLAAVARIMGEVRQLRDQSNNHAADIRSVNEQLTATALATPPAVTIPAPPPGTEANSVTVTEASTPAQ